MRLDVACMRYLSREHFRVLVAIEMGMRNHELVPVPLIESLAHLRGGGGLAHKVLSTLLRYKLVAHEAVKYDGYRLTYHGYDVLALRALMERGVICAVGRQIGIGKESDIYLAQRGSGVSESEMRRRRRRGRGWREGRDEEQRQQQEAEEAAETVVIGEDQELGPEDLVVLKFHRLGRTSFRAVARKRDYLHNSHKHTAAGQWLYLSRLAALKEYAFMQVLEKNGFPVPAAVDHNRHVVAMTHVAGFPLAQVKSGRMADPEPVFAQCVRILRRLGQCGLVHCDFNEFNLMVDTAGRITLIDFPQMVSVDHPNANELFLRDLNGLIKFFAMKMRYIPPDDLVPSNGLADIQVAPLPPKRPKSDPATAAAGTEGAAEAGASAGGAAGVEGGADPGEGDTVSEGSGSGFAVRLDAEVHASGFSTEQDSHLTEFILRENQQDDGDASDDTDEKNLDAAVEDGREAGLQHEEAKAEDQVEDHVREENESEVETDSAAMRPLVLADHDDDGGASDVDSMDGGAGSQAGSDAAEPDAEAEAEAVAPAGRVGNGVAAAPLAGSAVGGGGGLWDTLSEELAPMPTAASVAAQPPVPPQAQEQQRQKRSNNQRHAHGRQRGNTSGSRNRTKRRDKKGRVIRDRITPEW